MITTLATQQITVRRPTSFVLDAGAISSSVSASTQPGRSSVIEVRVYNNTGSASASGTVNVVGSLDGASVSESLNISIGTFAQTIARFDAVTRFEFGGDLLTASPTPYATARAIGPGGENQQTTSVLVSGWPAHIEQTREMYTGGAEGMDRKNDTVCLITYAETWEPKVGDIIIDEDSAQFLVRGVRLQRAKTLPKHWTVYISERGDSA